MKQGVLFYFISYLFAVKQQIPCMFKNLFRYLGQQLLGFDRYLFVFSVFNTSLIRLGLSEKAFRHFMWMIPEEAGVILDIGANIGAMTVSLASRFPKAKVYAFEPVPENVAAWNRVVVFYGLSNATVFPFALGEVGGTAAMILPLHKGSKMQGWSHIAENAGQEAGYRFTVAVKALDTVPALLETDKITAIKIDVENFEYFVLKGGIALLKKHKPLVFCELWNDERRKKCIELMERLGYFTRIYNGKQLEAYHGQEALDFFFVPGG